MTLLPSLRDLLQVFSAEMTAPTFRNFLVITAGWLFASRHTVASAVQASGNARNRHHSAFYSTFSRAAWDVDQVGWNLARMVLERYCPHVDKPVEIGADDTNAAKSGRKIFGTGWHYDPLADSPKGKSTTWAHNWVTLAILAEPLRDQAKRVAMGVQARLYVPPKTAEKQNLAYRTKLDQLADMLGTLCKMHPGRKFRLLAYAAYGVGEMITRLPSKCDLISRLRSDARLFRPVEAVPPNARRKAGRPRIRGPEMDKAAAIFGKCKRRSAGTLTLYGKAKKVEWVTVLACPGFVQPRVQFVVEKLLLVACVLLHAFLGGTGTARERFQPNPMSLRNLRTFVGLRSSPVSSTIRSATSATVRAARSSSDLRIISRNAFISLT